MFQQRTWILQRANIEILRECQRYIADLFSEKISLTQKDLIEKIFYFSTRSQNKPFHEAVERLKHSLIEAAFDFSQLPEYEQESLSVQKDQALESKPEAIVQASPEPKKRTRMYRGREVVVETPPQGFDKPVKHLTSSDETFLGEEVKPLAKKKRIYRGREF